MPGGMLMRKCKRKPPHPCDPKPPCDICDDGEACPEPSLCVERINNPEVPYETHCKPGSFLPASVCKIEIPHPCDPPPPCKPGKQKSKPCKPALCKERINNLEEPFLRCPHPDDIFSDELCENLDMLKQPIPECSSKDPCPSIVLKDPFEDEVEPQDNNKKVEDPNEYLYSRELCKHLDMLRQSIRNCFTSDPCAPPELRDPFEDEPQVIPEKKDPCDIDPRVEAKKRREK